MFDRNQRAWVSKLAEGRKPTPEVVVRSRVEHHPQPGDIVIAREAAHPSVRYTIGLHGRQPQLSCDSRDNAVALARTYVADHRADIWERVSGRFTSIAPRKS